MILSISILEKLIQTSSQLIAFNWKEKKILRLDLKKKKRELKNTGKIPEEELHEIFNSDGALFREIKMDEDFDSTTFFPDVEKLKFNDKKVIDVTKLYGSSKPRMAIIRKHTGKSRFSHRKIFGNKFADAAQE